MKGDGTVFTFVPVNSRSFILRVTMGHGTKQMISGLSPIRLAYLNISHQVQK